MADTLIELAERCEKAEGPDRELDFAILCVVDPRALKTGILPGDPKFTASLDAAATLVPDGCRFYVDNGTVDEVDCHACVYQYEPRKFSGGCRDAASPALALCAAALRARAAMKVAA